MSTRATKIEQWSNRFERFQKSSKGESSLMGKMWAYRGLDKAPYNIFDFSGSNIVGAQEVYRYAG